MPQSAETESLMPTATYPSIVHPGAIVSMLHLIAMLDQQCPEEKESSDDSSSKLDWEGTQLQYCLLDVINQLFGSERNQQLMCSVAMPRELLTLFPRALAQETAPLHSRVQCLFESLVTQALTPNDLR
ncbi:unnamed protein product [Echinostoma caproni]|uniref:Uncharacterized protein n=1 Tax=Echinostoma caproni TaxID=27848 RepID=A0A3P8IBP3_9TREM|nr:unnamed protein product [Echinostoma caproni]